MADEQELKGPDLESEGLPASELADGEMRPGHFQGDSVVLVRSSVGVIAIGGGCSHYGGPLAEGLFDGSTVRCPWHHACFDVRSGRAVRAPALDAIPMYSVEERDGRLYVTGKLAAETATATPPAATPSSVVIVGAGAAGNAAAEGLRDGGYEGQILLLGNESGVPVDRPNLSKDFLAGNAPDEWLPLRSEEFYRERRIDLRTGVTVERLDPERRSLTFADGSELHYGALLLATGADPVRLNLEGDGPELHYLRSLEDSRAIVGLTENARRAVVIGASFIGTEVAGSLRERGLEVHVVEPEPRPLERVLGPDLGDFVRALHEEHGVTFHLGRKVTGRRPGAIVLDDGTELEADIVVAGVGVRPRIQLAEAAGIDVDNGVLVDEYLRTSAPGVWAAGDIARWPDPHSGERIRVEHWVVAERQGQAAARDILGRGEPFRDVPFFWSQHYDVPINYVGHAESWDEIEVQGNIEDRDCLVAFRKDGRVLAVASIYRDLDSLRAELALERGKLLSLEELSG